MKVLVVGSGGREHAIAWKLAQSARLRQLYIAPGNAGTAILGANVSIAVEDIDELVRFAQKNRIDLVVIGPELPLTLGLADALQSAGISVFGPSKAAAQLEGSKAFAKDFMARLGIPTARYATFDCYEAAVAFVESSDYPVVIKATGLAAGKGVILPNTIEEARACLHSMLIEGAFGEAGRQVVIEERLEGQEISLLGFTDGQTVRWMPPAQDHKRLLDGDQGPNTGGMGAYAPAPICPPALAEQIAHLALQTAVDGLRQAGTPYVGVLYAGMILTHEGPKVLEYNCRLGDPEAQAILPLLDSDLLEILLACVEGRLSGVKIRWKDAACACVVLATEKYPYASQSGLPIEGLGKAVEDTFVFHAGTRLQDNQIVASGGRILGVTGWGADLPTALERAYRAVGNLYFQGMQYRRDIGHHALEGPVVRSVLPKESCGDSAYRRSGVSIDAGNRAVELMTAAVYSTYTHPVIRGIGAFGGCYDASWIKELHQPVLVSSIDGVGTKVKLAAQVGRFRSIGQDLVNHCINDILVQGARPLFFLDYFATSVLKPEIVAEIVSGMAESCRAAGCALIGGETAEMPGVYLPDEFDLAGTIVGVAERSLLLPKATIAAGDRLIGLRSSGPHTNGYSLIRRVFQDVPMDTVYPELNRPLSEVLLEPHRSYLHILQPLVEQLDSPIKALVHITGGAFIENIPRVLPAELGVVLWKESWPVPPLFHLIQARLQAIGVEASAIMEEMYRVFNLGIGMVIIVAPQDVRKVQDALGEESWVIGEVLKGERKVTLA